MAVLNTNTRYLHEEVLRYAERLTATLPDPLSVCFFVNSGSEANDLALRLIRAHSGAQDVVCVEHGYHGHTQALVDVSPYKHAGPGGRGAPPWVHVAAMPDPYRGMYRGYDPSVGQAYADDVARCVRETGDRGLAGMIVESMIGCGGQVVLPDGYLVSSAEHVRAAGGLVIADEVQVGFGRVGPAFWGFATQGLVPDVVTVGKPAGDGHPLAAVITTPEIAASFANGMEYFNTFGGNPVSAAIGNAVLDVIEEEDLPLRAQQVGRRILAGVIELAIEHELIGDARGLGLYLGVELVRDRDDARAGRRRGGVRDRADAAARRPRQHGRPVPQRAQDQAAARVDRGRGRPTGRDPGPRPARARARALTGPLGSHRRPGSTDRRHPSPTSVSGGDRGGCGPGACGW